MDNKSNDLEYLKKQTDDMLSSFVSKAVLPFTICAASNKQNNFYEGCFGNTQYGNASPVDMDTIILLASATKPITATAALQLIEKGKLELDVPVSTYVPQISKLVVLKGWNIDKTPITSPPHTAITLRHLLTHTSGLSYEIWNEDVLHYMKYKNIPSLATLNKKCLFTPLIAEPGTKWEYGISIDWVGQIIEAVSGQSLEEYFNENIFKPLGMNSSSFKLTQKMRKKLGYIHIKDKKGTFEPIDFIAEQNGDFEEAGGGLYSTANDYMHFLRMILNNGKANGTQILSSDSVKLLKENAIGNLKVRPFKTAMPDDSNDVEFLPGIDKSWSLGFMRNETITPTGRNPGSLAWAGLFNVYFWIDPKLELAGFFATQLQPFADENALKAFEKFETIVYNYLNKTLT